MCTTTVFTITTVPPLHIARWSLFLSRSREVCFTSCCPPSFFATSSFFASSCVMHYRTVDRYAETVEGHCKSIPRKTRLNITHPFIFIIYAYFVELKGLCEDIRSFANRNTREWECKVNDSNYEPLHLPSPPSINSSTLPRTPPTHNTIYTQHKQANVLLLDYFARLAQQ